MAATKPVALVIGASRGIGRQIAIGLAKGGYAVVVSAKTTSDASKTTPFPPDPNSPQTGDPGSRRRCRRTGSGH
ncbi:short-chain dehydrogenase [Histoplasma capsulatum]|uniref:Short-chain dehydrogenase n=1 Tax=Ajellomyces capsulatus TaxID=5037 RepID=A0A8A1MI59_AJECA|nr:short-chain dehydrogenase [Histoplasma capsulatum]